MPVEIKDKRIIQHDVDVVSGSFELDLIAFFELLQEETEKMVMQAEREGWPEDKLINEVSSLV